MYHIELTETPSDWEDARTIYVVPERIVEYRDHAIRLEGVPEISVTQTAEEITNKIKALKAAPTKTAQGLSAHTLKDWRSDETKTLLRL